MHDPVDVMRIRVRACVAVTDGGKLLLVPHYDTDAGPVQWHLPGGAVEPGERLRDAAAREALEETGLHVTAHDVLDVSEVVAPERSWYSVTIVFSGEVHGGRLTSEQDHPRGNKLPRWFTRAELERVPHHPSAAIARISATLPT
jgi:8-oxo-dGTP diphosphatase